MRSLIVSQRSFGREYPCLFAPLTLKIEYRLGQAGLRRKGYIVIPKRVFKKSMPTKDESFPGNIVQKWTATTSSRGPWPYNRDAGMISDLCKTVHCRLLQRHPIAYRFTAPRDCVLSLVDSCDRRTDHADGRRTAIRYSAVTGRTAGCS